MDTADYVWIGKHRSSGKGGGGVGFIVSQSLESNIKVLKGWDPDDILWITIQGPPGAIKLTIGLVYISPAQRDSDPEGVAQLLSQFMAAKEEYSKDSIVMLMGDLHFDVKRDKGKSYTEAWMQTIEEMNMEMVDSRGPLARQPTRYPPQKDVQIDPAHLDYLMIDTQWSHLATEEKILDGAAHSVGSDHVPIMMKLGWQRKESDSRPIWVKVLNMPKRR